ncbi:DNA polymerase I [Clostridium cellulovorans]|uniref:DNA polymerase I n=1 Tax=Clostridium cellulovorans (strain ATCC 35296 / DSM 3052 / OCM 3 / 743B) TaxID=573061 RepID=D9SRJ8_CLOC7|nr:DNA polymerase I [Clostridium cellulovorans]ADL52427.1 DNA polymerase I [Clostridium cellulovorans 743B]
MGKLVILDGHSLMNRAFYAIPPLTTAEGLHTNAIFGFINMLFKIREDIKPDYIVTTFDRKAPTFRHEEYQDYKAGRKRMPDELHEQFEPLKDILSKMAINIFEIDGFEADDLIGTLAVKAESEGIEVYIVTGDRDALQLASDNIKVLLTKKGVSEREVYDRNRMIEDYGVTPTQFIDVKGLMGDASDNIPGVPGIGEKTAYKLIKEYGSIEGVLDNLDKLKGKIKENLESHCEDAIFSKKLATIITNVPIDIDLDDIKSQEAYDVKALRELFFKYQFKSLINKLPEEENQGQKPAVEVVIEKISTLVDFEKLTENVDTELFIVHEISGKEKFSLMKLEKLYIHNSKSYEIEVQKLFEENEEKSKEYLKKLFENTSEKIIHNAKNLFTVLSKLDIDINNFVFDTEIAAYLIESSDKEYTLKTLFETYLHETYQDISQEISNLSNLYQRLKEKIKELQMEDLLYKIELPLVKVLADMEKVGFKVDREQLDQLREKFINEITVSQKEIYEMAGEEFNISSPKQLGKILFEKLDLPVIKKTKTGYSTNAEVLEKLKDKHPIIDKITYYRQLTKLNSTYVEGLIHVIDQDGRIHSSFNQTVTTTGRLSSTEPNLQNIPIKYEMGRAIRKVFVPNDEESLILSADYSQIELRVLAHMADDENMKTAYLEHIDIHTKTASEVFNLPLDQVTKEKRSAAKAVNFGIVYGISDFALSEDLKISKKEAKQYIDTYFSRYPKVKEYISSTIAKAEKELYVNTIFNRRRFIPEITSSNKIVKALGDRLAMNAPIQGSAADIIKLAMVNVSKRLKEEKLKSSLILQVHDEIILNVYKDELETVKELVKKEMESVIDFSVPLEVDINTGTTWYDAK